MGQADLNRLILRVTEQRLETTREARQRLIETAPNLFLLRTLIENLVARVNEERRSWASYDDVIDVESELIAKLETGEARHVGQWIRDALNDAETVNQWRPRAQYPVALAIARARADGAMAERDVIARAERFLNEWSTGLSEGSLERLSFGQEQIEHHLRALSDDKILQHARFRSPLMQAWLIGDGRNGYPQAGVDALIKAAYREIRLPEGAEAIGGGGQASIFRFVRDGAQMAFRRVEIRSDEDRKRFIETAQALDALSRGDYRDEPGARYIFELESIGFAADSSMTALQVYRWIEGHDLSEKIGSLGPAIVADLGVKLALALELIHARGILHRDVQPKNIVLSQDGKRPVLIDFGMARLAQRPMGTALAGEYAAPEVRLDPPKWTKAADIFALGKTLERLLTRNLADNGLGRALRRSVAESASERPDAASLGRALRAALDDLHVEQRKQEAWESIASAAAADREKHWYWQVLESFRGNVSAMALGLPADAFERCAEVADLVNQVLEAYPLPRGETRRLSLGFVKNENDRTGKELATLEVDFLHRARTWLSHGDRKFSKKQRALREFGEPTAEDMKILVKRGVESLARYLRLSSLTHVVDLLLA
jgi:serine/threonine protein kinase